MPKLFGTDGIRGVAGKDITADLALRLGKAVGDLIIEKNWSKKLLIGRDSRLSGPMLESALISGAMSKGIHVDVLGIVPTPVVAFLTREFEYPLGCVISASHNPIEDNGIKFFDNRGMKVPDEIETRLEQLLESESGIENPATGTAVGGKFESATKVDEYVKHLMDIGQDKISGLKIVVDAAYGAACMLAPSVFTLLGVQVIPMNCIADGGRINVNCGATNVGLLRDMVVKTGSDMGVALDGDADRAILIDENGKTIDGDQILAMWGLHLLRNNALQPKTIVGTVLSNQGLEAALGAGGGKLERAPVGDKFVLEKMLETGAKIGGEQSGHVIFLDYHTTGDGILTALMVAMLMRSENKLLSELGSQMRRFPQVQLNIAVTDKQAALKDKNVKNKIEALSRELDKIKGRLLVRPSGTESVIRVMTEAPDEAEARRLAEMAIDLFRVFSENGVVTEI